MTKDVSETSEFRQKSWFHKMSPNLMKLLFGDLKVFFVSCFWNQSRLQSRFELLLRLESGPAAVNWSVTSMTHHHSVPRRDPTPSHLASVLGLPLPSPSRQPRPRLRLLCVTRPRCRPSAQPPPPLSLPRNIRAHSRAYKSAVHAWSATRWTLFLPEEFCFSRHERKWVRFDPREMSDVAIGARSRRTTKTSLRPPVGVYLGHCVYVCRRRARRARRGVAGAPRPTREGGPAAR